MGNGIGGIANTLICSASYHCDAAKKPSGNFTGPSLGADGSDFYDLMLVFGNHVARFKKITLLPDI